MTVYAVVAGNQIVTADANQYKQLLIDATMTDQPLATKYSGASPVQTLTQQAASAYAQKLQGTSTTGYGGWLLENDRAADANFLQGVVYGSSNAGTVAGIAVADYALIAAGGGNNLGLILATLGNTSIWFATNGAVTARAFPSTGWVFGGAYGDPGSGILAVKGNVLAGYANSSIAELSSGTSYVQLQPSAASDTTAHVYLIPKGNGIVRLYAEAYLGYVVGGDYVDAIGYSGGNNKVLMRAVGGDTNIDMHLAAKGSGSVLLENGLTLGVSGTAGVSTLWYDVLTPFTNSFNIQNRGNEIKILDDNSSKLVAGFHKENGGNTGGMVVGSDGTSYGGPAYKGQGTINVNVGLYLSGTAYTNPGYVFERWLTGHVVKYADQPGAVAYGGPMSVLATEAHVRRTFDLPGFNPEDDLFRRAGFTLAKLEEAWIALFDHEHRILELERKIELLTAGG